MNVSEKSKTKTQWNKYSYEKSTSIRNRHEDGRLNYCSNKRRNVAGSYEDYLFSKYDTIGHKTYVVFGYGDIGNAANDSDEVEHVPRVAEVIL